VGHGASETDVTDGKICAAGLPGMTNTAWSILGRDRPGSKHPVMCAPSMQTKRNSSKALAKAGFKRIQNCGAKRHRDSSKLATAGSGGYSF
jgi:hypothetical protein